MVSKAEPFRATIIMKLARARLAAGDKAGCLKAMALLDAMEYVPDHHALAAEELKIVLAGKRHPAHERTQVPPIRQVQAMIVGGRQS